MLGELVNEYAAYFNLDINSEFQTVQSVVDNMLTRLEELTSVLQMIKQKNTDCSSSVSEDICKYRSEITTLSKKVATVLEIIAKLQSNVDTLETRIEKAEIEFGVNNDNRIKSFLKPFLKMNKAFGNANSVQTAADKTGLESVLSNFEE